MRNPFACLALALLVAGAGYAQTTRTTDHKPAVQKTEAAPEKPAANASLPSQAAVNDFLRHMFGYDPEIKWNIAAIKPAFAAQMTEIDVVLSNPQGQQLTKLYVTPDGKYAIAGDLIPFGADPFAHDRGLLDAQAKGPSQGPADAAVTVVEFGDLECPSCKAAQPTIEKLLGDVPNARLIFQQFPLTQIHPWALKASEYSVCVARQSNDLYFKFMKNVYQNQEQITAENADQQLKAAALAAGANPESVATCASEPSTLAQIKLSQQLGVAVDVTGTPTLFINGRKISNVGGIPYETLKAITEFQAKSR